MKDPLRLIFYIVATLGLCACLIACNPESEGEAGTAHEHSHAADAGGEHAEHAESSEHGEHAEGGEHAHGEHAEGGEHSHGEEGEESGVYIPRLDTWDEVRRGARLVLSLDTDQRAFVGRVENTTSQTLCAVRVEVHLSSGTELGPTERTDVAAGESIEVVLPTSVMDFNSWTAHPEMSPCGG